MYHTESGTVTLNERTVIDKKLRPNFGFLNISTTPEQGAKVFVDEEYIGLSPVKTDKLKKKTKKNSKKVKKKDKYSYYYANLGILMQYLNATKKFLVL